MHLLPRKLLNVLMLLAASATASAGLSISEAAKLLPGKIGSFQAVGPAKLPLPTLVDATSLVDVGVVSEAGRVYRDEHGSSIVVRLLQLGSESGAYAFLTGIAAETKETIKTGVVGTATVTGLSSISFYKGNSFVQLWGTDKGPATQEELLQISRAFAGTLPNGDEDVPVLVKHLPSQEQSNSMPRYAVTITGLKRIVPAQPILDVLTFEGGTEAVVAHYGLSQLVIVEFTTPQFSIDNDQRVAAKIQELKGQGQPVPTAYRRVGNYSVFVFNAPDEKSANQLIDQVKYEQVVQWLGDDPHLYERLQRYLTQTSAGVLMAVLKSSGVSLILCLGIGALIGTLLFRHRRAQKAAAYSDAGGAVRLNLDQLTSTEKSDGLLGSGTASKSDPDRP